MISLIHTLRAFLSGDGALILPELELALFAIGILVIDRWLTASEKRWNTILALAGAAFSAFTLYVQFGRVRALTAATAGPPWLLGFQKSILVDPLFLFFAALLLATAILAILLSSRYLDLVAEQRGAYYAFVLLACMGAMTLASSINLFVAVAGVAIMALGGSWIVGLFQLQPDAATVPTSASTTATDASATPSAASPPLILRPPVAQSPSVTQSPSVILSVAKDPGARPYAWQCAISCIALLLGALLLYGLFHTANLGRIGAAVELRLQDGVALGGLTGWRAWLALAALVSATLFLIDAAPFHWFAADFLEDAAVPAAAFLSVTTKLAGFALLLRTFSFVLLFAQQKWIHVWGALAILSLLWGSIAALRQKSVLRLLAYGSVAHTGFVLLGLVAANDIAFPAVAYYIGSYVFMTIGAFAVLIVLRQCGIACTTLTDLHGLYRRSPAAGLALLFCLLALAGVPPTAGFLAKYYIVKALLAAPHPELAAFAVANALLAAYGYTRIAVHIFRPPAVQSAAPPSPAAPPFAEPLPTGGPSPAAEQSPTTGEAPNVFFSNLQTVALTAAVFVSLAAGLYPAPFLRIASYVFGQ